MNDCPYNHQLDTQKANGGWRGWDVDAITFNDEVTTGALELFLLIKQGDRRFEWLGKEDRERRQSSCGINKNMRDQ